MHRVLYGVEERSEESYELHLPVKDVDTLQESLNEWAEPERLEGDNCYTHPSLGSIEANKNVMLDVLPDTMLINFNRMEYNFVSHRMDVVSKPINVPLTFSCSELANVLHKPSTTQYHLVAFMVGSLRRRTPDDQYVCWHAYIRVPNTDEWHYIDRNPIAECVQYTTRHSIPTEHVLDLLSGESSGDEFLMKAWYQRLDAVVQSTTPSVAAWEESWREELEISVGMDQGTGSHRSSAQVAIGVPVANVI